MPTILTIAIPVYNSEKTISESIESALSQKGKEIEVLLIDDASTDRTVEIINKYPVRFRVNEFNAGIGINLERLMKAARGKYILYLCGDDQFTDEYVAQDYIDQFERNKKLGIIGRYYYQYMNGHPGAIMVSRDKNILTQSCNPSGMAFRVDRKIKGTNRIFIEMPSIVKQYLINGYEWTMFEYDTVKARIHPGGNTGTKESYYTESMYQNWYDLLGEPLNFPQGYIQIKNRAPKNLWREICTSVKLNKKIFFSPLSLFSILTALTVPSSVLKPFVNFWRHRITRMFVKIIERGDK